jgi:hypothetical protein
MDESINLPHYSTFGNMFGNEGVLNKIKKKKHELNYRGGSPQGRF